MKSAVILSEAYSARVSAVEALLRAAEDDAPNPEDLRAAATGLDEASVLYGHASTGAAYSAFADLLRIAAMLVEWRSAVLGAAPDADRFIRAAIERHKLWLSEYGANELLHQLVASVEALPTLSIGEVVGICRRIAATPLPIGVFASETRGLRLPQTSAKEEKEPAPVDLAVAFLRFAIDGKPAGETHYLTPREAHDLEIDVRVSRWPEGAQTLELAPVTIEAAATYDFPRFAFRRPEGKPPFMLKQRGRAVLNVAQSLNARPFEFKYAAQFHPNAVEQPVAVVGQRTLRIEGIDIDKAPLTGYRGVDRRLLAIRDQLRGQPGVYADDLSAALIVLTTLGSFAARAIQDALLGGTWSEAEFQDEVRNELRRQPQIASELEEHAHAGGGITDLSFRGIRIELKVESSRVTMQDCERFADQTLSYVVATGKCLGILCVLDCSPKQQAPFPAEEGIGVLLRRTNDQTVCIVAVLIQGNLARPSALSR